MTVDPTPVFGRKRKATRAQLVAALRAVDEAWDAWMEDEEGEGQAQMEAAILKARETLRNA